MVKQHEFIIIGITVILLGMTFAYGYHKGTVNQIRKSEKDRQELQNDLLDLNKTLNIKNREILQLSREKEDLINELENQALTAEGSSAPGIAAIGGLQRLERRWGPVTASP